MPFTNKAMTPGSTLRRLACLLVVIAAPLAAQTPTTSSDLPSSPGAAQLEAQSAGIISGTVTDTDEAAIANARITLEDVTSKVTRTVTSDKTGDFRFDSVPPGKYNLRIHEPGFASWKVEDVEVHVGEAVMLTDVELGVEAITSTVDAIFQEDLAEQQITAEEHQRILGILPNFYVTYLSNAAPLTRRQKFKLATKITIDPVTFLRVGVSAGIQQWQNDFSGYGEGFGGYSTRFGASYGNGVIATMFSGAIFPSLFRQDPRYFYNGKGTVIHRALYTIATVVICKGDNGKWQPNYSNVLGNLAAGGISSLYYPHSDQHSIQVTVSNTLVGTAEGAFSTLFQEFLLKHFTHGTPPPPNAPLPLPPTPPPQR